MCVCVGVGGGVLVADILGCPGRSQYEVTFEKISAGDEGGGHVNI